MDDIIVKYANDVKRFCMSLCHDQIQAEEMTQETFYRALKTIHRYNGTCSMTTWLFTIARRVWIDMLRKKRDILPIDEINEFELRNVNDPESIFKNNQKKEYLNSILYELKEPDYTVFILRAMMDKSFKEIGEEFKKSENWARVTYYRTRMKLMERMSKDEDSL